MLLGEVWGVGVGWGSVTLSGAQWKLEIGISKEKGQKQTNERTWWDLMGPGAGGRERAVDCVR